jgi:membrane-bound lytic murein transglycosylase D
LYTASNPPPTNASKEVVKADDEVLINDVPVVQAKAGETLLALADRAGLSLSHFMKYNDLDDNHKVVAGGYYFKEKKRSKTEQDFHKVKQGETLWQISQLYGLQIKRLRKYNHLDNDKLAAGEMVWLNSSKPKEGTVVDEDEPTVELNEDKSFDWGTPASNTVQVSIQTPSGSNNTTVPLDADTHTVLAGETLYSISRQHNLSVGDLKLINNLGSEGELKPGQILKLSVNEEVGEVITDNASVSTNTLQPAQSVLEPVSATEIFHEVKLSDTLYSVARQYGVTIKDLMECNNKKDFSVSLGERLKIPSK